MPLNFSRVVGDFVALTADGGADCAPHIIEMLGRLRAAFGMDVAFVSQFVSGQRVIRYVSVDAEDEYGQIHSASDPEEESYCRLIVDGRLPEVIRDTSALPEAMALAGTLQCQVKSHIAVPVVGEDGAVYGTVCCFSHQTKDHLGTSEELEALRSVAALLADVLTTRPR